MKKIVASVLALVMVLSLAACGNKNTPNTQGSASSVGGDTAPLKVALVVNQPFGDKGSMDDLPTALTVPPQTSALMSTSWSPLPPASKMTSAPCASRATT